MLGLLFNKAAGLQACNFIKIRLQHKCFPVNIAKFLSTYFEKHMRIAASWPIFPLYRSSTQSNSIHWLLCKGTGCKVVNGLISFITSSVSFRYFSSWWELQFKYPSNFNIRNSILLEAATKVFYKKVILKVLQNSQKNGCARTLSETLHRCLSFVKFLRAPFYGPGECFCTIKHREALQQSLFFM